MKTKLGIITIVWIALLISLTPAYAQAPSSLAGDGFLAGVSSGAYPLASYGYFLFIPANSGSAYQVIGIYNVINSSGTFTYAPTGASTATINANDSVGGQLVLSASFSSASSGSFYETAVSYPGAYQSGSFGFSSVNAPSSLAGRKFNCSVVNGISPFLTSGSYTITMANSGNTYTVSTGQSGTYSYSTLNRSTGMVQLNDSVTGVTTAYFGFSSATGGGFAIKASTGYQVGNFVLLDTTAPTVAITSPTTGQNWNNLVFTITGTASDNVQVAAVYYQVNSSGWNLASNADNWDNWSATVNLISGANTIQAYAVDTSGNISATTSVSFNVVLNTVLTVSTNGLGSLNPNYNNALLQVGGNYSITATAGTGFTFTNWTGGVTLPLAVLTNKATLQFVMQSNLVLQANFVDTSKPVLSITNLTAGQRSSNLVFTVKGTATDNWQVASVQVQLNGGIWTNATGTTNWSAPLTLTPGTNTLAAYATDTTGNNSTTNSVSWQYVVTNLLAVQATGLGTLSPNYSNSWLEIGRNYSMTATPATGFVVSNWTISTNWIGGRITNNATVQFMMASNLTLQVNFADVTKPTLTITAPTAGQKMTNALATFVGTSSDNWKVAGVWYQMNSNAWNLVKTTTNNYTNWTQTLPLVIGTNTLKAYALDLGGNFSTTNTLSVISSNTFMLQLTFTNSLPMTTNGMTFSLQLSKGLNGHIQISTNLTSWTTLTNFVGTNSTITFRDPAATNSPSRFYRAVIP